MKKLLINNLYIFSNSEKKAKCISFTEGKNIITSNEENGTKRGKSVIMKSIYYTLGADCYFEDKWDTNEKVTIIDVTIVDTSYYILRYNRLFKIYNKDSFEELFRTSNRQELSEFLSTLLSFAVRLPNKQSNELEITPPVYNYLLNYIDQDKLNGSHFTSFKGLQQYSDFKDKVLYYHFNVYNDEYYKIIKKIDMLNKKSNSLNLDKSTNQKILSKIDKSIDNQHYSIDIKTLQEEIEQTKDEYSCIVNKLNKIKNSLVKYRNQREDLISSIMELEIFSNSIEKDTKKIIEHKCPVCNSLINDNLELRIKNYDTVEDAMFLKIDLEESLSRLDREIKLEEEKYQNQLEVLNIYESKLKLNTKEVEDVLKYKGYIEVRESVIREIGEITSSINKNNDELDKLKKEIKKYEDKKKEVNKEYYTLMMKDKLKFDLKEIEEKSLKNISSVFNAGGSNKSIATVIWYMNLLKLRRKFNPDLISLPLVLDSPNNVETDEEKKQKLFNYIFSETDADTQLIVSTLGFNSASYKDFIFDNIIELENNKYELLNKEDYSTYKSLYVNLLKDNNY